MHHLSSIWLALASHLFTILMSIVVVVCEFWLVTIGEVEVINDGTYLVPLESLIKVHQTLTNSTGTLGHWRERKYYMFSSSDCCPLNMRITKLWFHVFKSILTFRYDLKPRTEKLGECNLELCPRIYWGTSFTRRYGIIENQIDWCDSRNACR